MESELGLVLRGWQAYACDRALEHDADGALVWSQVLLTVARQSGKSTLARGVSLWRMHEGRDLFGNDQLVLSAANKLPTAWEVMEKGLGWVESRYPGAVRRGNNRPGITLPNGGRWVPLAANRGAGTGYSATMLFVDEVWDIDDRVVDDDLEPTLAEAESGQVWLTSTAGDSGSTLFSARRAKAIAQIQGDGEGDEDRMLILEWSAPPEADIEDENTWRWASPEWSDKRVKYLRDKWKSTTNVDSFRTQYGNQWVRKLDGWLNSRSWSRTLDPDRALPADRPWSLACEVSKDEAEHAVAVAAEDADGRIVVRLYSARTYRDVDELVAGIRRDHPALTVWVTPSYLNRVRFNIDGTVGAGQVGTATATLLDAFGSGTIAHDGSAHLEEHLFRAELIKHDNAYKLVGKGDVHAHGARAVMFAVWKAAQVQKPAPAIHVRRTG